MLFNDLKKECIDPDLAEHYKELLKQWVMDELSIKERLDKMKEKLEKRFDELEVSLFDPVRRKKTEGKSE